MSLNLDWVASTVVVAEAERMLAAMTENLPAEFVSVATAAELTEKVTDDEVEAIVAVGFLLIY